MARLRKRKKIGGQNGFEAIFFLSTLPPSQFTRNNALITLERVIPFSFIIDLISYYNLLTALKHDDFGYTPFSGFFSVLLSTISFCIFLPPFHFFFDKFFFLFHLIKARIADNLSFIQLLFSHF